MHEFARQIVEEFDPVQLVNPSVLVERDHPLWVLAEIGKFRRWAGIAGSSNTQRPSVETLRELLGRGRAALVALFRAFEQATPKDESLVTLRALAALVRTAKLEHIISWDLDSLKPGSDDKRLLVSFDPTLDERLRAAAAAEKQSLSDFVRCSVQARVEAIEKRRPRTSGTNAATA
jgi:predicted HicB family RNase H-like nuclease